jgi:TetR/AcrR family transcriptional regulator, mexJK operon transcriptional repressor
MSHCGEPGQGAAGQCPPKRRQILAGAREVFREAGFERAGVDQIAARAGVSKATVYHHFGDKQALYAAYLSEEADDLRASVRCMLLESEPSGEIEAALRCAGTRLLELALDPVLVRFYRNTSAEVERFPELGQLLFDNGPAAMFVVIGGYLKKWQAHGELVLPDPHAAAVQFVMLCHGDLFVRAQLGALPDPLQPAIAATVDRAVDAFLAIYRA